MAVVEILRECGQIEVADRLNVFNKSPGLMKYNTNALLEITPRATPITGVSNSYDLIKIPRGKCIIINNLETPQFPSVVVFDEERKNDEEREYLFTPKGLRHETTQMEHIFTQFNFVVKVINNLSAKQMEEQLVKISKEKSLEDDEAFVLIVMSHGENKKVLGYNACEAIRKHNFGELKTETDKAEAIQEITNDSIEIKDMVQIFSEEEDKCPQLKSKPKLFFFICCRNEKQSESEIKKDSENFKEIPIPYEEIKGSFPKKGGRSNKNLDTFVCYSSSKGFESIYDLKKGMSVFGMAFTQSMAQYACDQPLRVIMNWTNVRLKEMFKKEKESEMTDEERKKWEEKLSRPIPKLTMGSFAIEIHTLSMDKEVFFNPGF